MKLLKVGMLLGALLEEGCASIVCTGLDSKVHYFKWPSCVHNPKQNGGLKALNISYAGLPHFRLGNISRDVHIFSLLLPGL